ncbi:hypothetical protein [Geobacter sp.]|uniref:hypothetical protein n=1 Tax=Geobacter sp. TaxID=46610 RepID=UPI0027B98B75|nr:hypothetical protein [Geobacter sp.]
MEADRIHELDSAPPQKIRSGKEEQEEQCHVSEIWESNPDFTNPPQERNKP